MTTGIKQEVEGLINMDKMECGEKFAKFFFDSVGYSQEVSDILTSKTKKEFVKKASVFADAIKDKETFRILVAFVNALPWDVSKEEKGTEKDEKTATYLLVCVKFNYACMCKGIERI